MERRSFFATLAAALTPGAVSAAASVATSEAAPDAAVMNCWASDTPQLGAFEDGIAVQYVTQWRRVSGNVEWRIYDITNDRVIALDHHR